MAQRGNPFVVAPETRPRPAADTLEDLLDHDVIQHGPASPAHVTVALPEDTTGWPQTIVTDFRAVTVFGLHGGAGTSTLASLFGEDALDAGTGWPVPGGWTRPLPTLDVLAVARTHHAGLAAAEAFTNQWGAGHLPSSSRLLGLVLVDDGPVLTDGQKKAVKRLARKVPRGAHLPWMEAWRHLQPDPDRLPRRITKIIHAFRTHR
ncbi:hypothetical protein E7744_14945 (plasmid) [Citricoccus sp. SGAir0253]|uniref:DUF6668 family protein n=1 Tax=Citricoccus sp. SGAir0253 TaxID=2567881 RepID=UPI0010CD08FE|nr:DUF6668 family protein [Citricoccus sp. SGAir0253]QCU79614.1 hypothetical protein E7744_14945 [Citricoccus sp. SGAir0253]